MYTTRVPPARGRRKMWGARARQLADMKARVRQAKEVSGLLRAAAHVSTFGRTLGDAQGVVSPAVAQVVVVRSCSMTVPSDCPITHVNSFVEGRTSRRWRVRRENTSSTWQLSCSCRSVARSWLPSASAFPPPLPSSWSVARVRWTKNGSVHARTHTRTRTHYDGGAICIGISSALAK